MFLNKRGLLPTLVLMFTLIAFGAALFYYGEAMDNQKGYVGVSESDFYEILVQSEKDIFYDQFSMEQRFNELIIEFGENGAMFPNAPSAFDNTRYWSRGGIDCYPDLSALENNFVDYLNLEVIKGDYDLDIIFKQGGGMTIILNPIIPYNITGANYQISYLPSNQIVYESDYDFNLFLESIDKVKEIVFQCGSENTCWEENADFYWQEDNKVYKFKLISGKIADAFGEKEVILSAAVDFNDINLLAGDEFKCSD